MAYVWWWSDVFSYSWMLHFKQTRSIKMLFHYSEHVCYKLSVAPSPTQGLWLTQECKLFLGDSDLIKALQMSVLHLICSQVSYDLVKHYDSQLAGTTHFIADSRENKEVTLWNTNEPLPTEPCVTSCRIFASHPKFVDSAEVFFSCPHPILNGEWQTIHDFGQHFRKKLAFDLKLRLDWIRLN